MSVKKRIRKNKPKKSRKDRKHASGGSLSGIVRLLSGFLGIVFLSLVFILGHDIMTQGRLFAARKIEVAGNRHLSKEQVLNIAGIQPGVNIFSVNLSLARQRLLSSGWIAEARVGREITDRLVVKVREHEPVARLGLDKTYIMSREGTVIKEWEEKDPSGLPLVFGLDYSDLPLGGGPPREPFASLLSVLSVAERDEGVLALNRIECIDVDRDLGITLHATGSVKTVRIGFGKYTEKLERIDRLLKFLDRQPTDPALEILELDSDSRIVAGPFLEAAFDTTTRRS